MCVVFDINIMFQLFLTINRCAEKTVYFLSLIAPTWGLPVEILILMHGVFDILRNASLRCLFVNLLVICLVYIVSVRMNL